MNGNSPASGYSFANHMVDQRPRFDNQMRKRGRRENQVMGKKSGIIRPDKRKKVKFL